LNIEANKSVIQRLEPIAKRIAEMTPEEQKAFKLPDGLGDGYSKTIYKRVIKKIYDKDRGQEVNCTTSSQIFLFELNSIGY
jgi:paired amphipathic helix protein Sin3a